MLEGLRKALKPAQFYNDGKVRQLTQELEGLEPQGNQLNKAVERGLLPLDEMLTTQAIKIQAQRQALLVEIAWLRRIKQMPTAALGEKKVHALS